MKTEGRGQDIEVSSVGESQHIVYILQQGFSVVSSAGQCLKR